MTFILGFYRIFESLEKSPSKKKVAGQGRKFSVLSLSVRFQQFQVYKKTEIMKKSVGKLLGAVLFSIFVSSLVSCGSSRKPQPFLDKQEMCSLFSEIRISETLLYKNRETGTENNDRVMLERSLDVYVPIFKKYGLNYRQFQDLMRYYMDRPEEMEEILKCSARQLQDEADRLAASDSAAKAGR